MRPELATGLRLPPRPADAGARQYAYHNQARYVRRWSDNRGALPCPASPPGHNADKLVHYFPLAHGTHAPRSNRKSVAQGKSVPVRVDLGGRRSVKKKQHKHNRAKSKQIDIKREEN